MLDSEIRAFLKICEKQYNKKKNQIDILEWGSGYSTLYFPKKLKEMGVSFSWTAIEHHPEWAKDVQNMTKEMKEVTLIEAPLSKAYTQAPKGHYDIALVDGRMRNECIVRAEEIADLTLLHDAQRKRYPVPGTYVAPRLKIVGKDNFLSKIHPLLWKLRVFVWKNTKARFLNAT